MTTITGFGKVELFEDFLLSADHPGWNDNVDGTGTAAQLANREDGFLELTTGATSGNRSQVTGERVWRAESGGPLIFEAGVVMVSAVTNRAVYVGWTDLTSIENPIEVGASDVITTNASDAVGFAYDTDAATDRWFVVGVDSDTDAAGAGVLAATFSEATPVAGTQQSFRVETNIDGTSWFYINNGLVYRTGTGWSHNGMTSSVSPDVNLCPTVLVETRTAGAATVYVDYIYCSKGRNP